MAAKRGMFAGQSLVLFRAPRTFSTERSEIHESCTSGKMRHLLAQLARHAPLILARQFRYRNEELFDVGCRISLVKPFVLQIVDIVDLNDRWLALQRRYSWLVGSLLRLLRFWGVVLISSISVFVDGEHEGPGTRSLG